MFRLLRLFAFSGLLFLTASVFGQTQSKLEAKGEKYLSNEEFEEMISYVESLGEDAKNDPLYHYYMGMSYYFTPDKKEKSTLHFEQYLDETGEAKIIEFGHQHIYMMLGTMYHLLYRFDDAQEMYRQFIASVENIEEIPSEDRQVFIKNAERQIDHCEYGKVQIKNPRHVLIESLGDSINTKYPDYAPVVSQDETTLIFTSRRPDTRGGKKAPTGGYYEDIYTATLAAGSLKESEHLLADTTRGQYFHLATDFKYENFHRMNDEVNSKDHDGSIQLDKKDKILYFYRDADIWSVGITKDTIKKAEKLGSFVNSDYHEPSIFFSYDGKKLFIVSDRPGGYGGLDIYLSVKEGDEWGEPKNLGPNVNTEYDEDAPYLDPDGKTLYFSSKGHSSMGGFDIFRCTEEDTTYSVPVNIGFPVNTPADDIYFTMTDRYNRAYYASSDLSGRGATDLYRITFTDERDPVAELFGKVTNEKGIALDALVTLTSEDGESITKQTDEEGKYFLLLGHGKKYSITIEANDFAPYKMDFSVPELQEYVQFYQEIQLRHVKTDDGETVGQEMTVYNAFGDTHEEKYDPVTEAHIRKIEKARTIKGNIRVFKSIQFYVDQPPLEKMVEEEEIFDLTVENFIYVLNDPNADKNLSESYTEYTGPKNRDEWLKMYPPDPDVPEGTIDGAKISGLFFTVQIGVYSRDVNRSVLFNLDPIVTLKTAENLYRYSTGTFTSVEEATIRKDQIVKIGITDAFVTAYFNGERITIEKALSLIEEHGPSVLKQ